MMRALAHPRTPSPSTCPWSLLGQLRQSGLDGACSPANRASGLSSKRGQCNTRTALVALWVQRGVGLPAPPCRVVRRMHQCSACACDPWAVHCAQMCEYFLCNHTSVPGRCKAHVCVSWTRPCIRTHTHTHTHRCSRTRTHTFPYVPPHPHISMCTHTPHTFPKIHTHTHTHAHTHIIRTWGGADRATWLSRARPARSWSSRGRRCSSAEAYSSRDSSWGPMARAWRQARCAKAGCSTWGGAGPPAARMQPAVHGQVRANECGCVFAFAVCVFALVC